MHDSIVGTREHGERSGVGILCNLLVLGNKAFAYIEMLTEYPAPQKRTVKIQNFLSTAFRTIINKNQRT